ncbi:hypothetical protein GCM10022267_36910 [Lentzea roselyniae]|uniref:Uncharacterized protein n=1 Tax=Lentzea roselyniae TaxID=531940 RepID=A0ABP7B409_9PSEU
MPFAARAPASISVGIGPAARNDQQPVVQGPRIAWVLVTDSVGPVSEAALTIVTAASATAARSAPKKPARLIFLIPSTCDEEPPSLVTAEGNIAASVQFVNLVTRRARTAPESDSTVLNRYSNHVVSQARTATPKGDI